MAAENSKRDFDYPKTRLIRCFKIAISKYCLISDELEVKG